MVPSLWDRWLTPESLALSVSVGVTLTIVARAAGLARGVVFARSMSRAELGHFSLSYNAISLVALVAVLGLPGALSRYIERYRRDGGLRSLIVQTIVGCALFGGVACAVGMLEAERLATYVFDDSRQTLLMILTCLGALALAYTNVLSGVYQGLRLSRVNSIMQVAQSIGFCVLGVGLLWLLRNDAVGGSIAFLLSSVLVLLLPTWLMGRYLQGLPRDRQAAPGLAAWQGLFAYAVATWSAGWLMELWRTIDRWLIVHYDTLPAQARFESIGSYNIVEMITQPLFALAMQISILVLPHVVHLWEAHEFDKAGHMVRLATKMTVLGLMCVAVPLVATKQLILAGIFGDHSPQGSSIVEPVLVAMIAASAHFVLRSYLLCRERNRLIGLGWIAALAVSVPLCLWWVPQWHLQGAAWATMVGGIVSALVVGLTSQWDGLRMDTATWLVMALPLALLAPLPVMFGVCGIVVIACIYSDRLIDRAEKAWVLDAMGRLITGLRRRLGDAGSL
ncbi:MAG: lipopolysaccharide biosynthesis protein [Pirellulales bacterium]|nr:lipopolysaccharide biosynthesis protein [Pirellulales bacterium]